MQLIPAAPTPTNSGVFAFSSAGTINGSGEAIAYIFRVPKSGTLDNFQVYLKTVSNNPDNGIRFSFQDVDSSGDPDGTQDQYRDVTSALSVGWLSPGLMTSTGADGGVKRVVVAGQLLACVIEFVNFVAGDSIAFGCIDDYDALHSLINLHYISQKDGTWSKVQDGGSFALLYNDATYGQLPWWFPATAFNTHTVSTSTSPDEYGLYFQTPMACTIDGAWLRIDIDAACTVKLYQESTLLKSVDLYSGQRRLTVGNNIYVPFGPISIQANTVYRITILPTTTTSISVYSFTVNSQGLLVAVDGVSTMYATERSDAGAWTDTVTQRPFMGPSFSGF